VKTRTQISCCRQRLQCFSGSMASITGTPRVDQDCYTRTSTRTSDRIFVPLSVDLSYRRAVATRRTHTHTHGYLMGLHRPIDHRLCAAQTSSTSCDFYSIVCSVYLCISMYLATRTMPLLLHVFTSLHMTFEEACTDQSKVSQHRAHR